MDSSEHRVRLPPGGGLPETWLRRVLSELALVELLPSALHGVRIDAWHAVRAHAETNFGTVRADKEGSKGS